MTGILSALKQIEDRAAHKPAAVRQAAASTTDVPASVTPPPTVHAEPDEEPAVVIEARAEVKAEAHSDHTLVDAICERLSASRQGAFLFVAPGGKLPAADPLVDVAAAVAERTGGKALVADCRGGTCGGAVGRSPLLTDRQSPVSLVSALPVADLERLLAELRRDYQIVLLVGSYPIDTRTACLAACCDGAYLVVQLGDTPRQIARRAVRNLRDHGGTVLGCVLLDHPATDRRLT